MTPPTPITPYTRHLPVVGAGYSCMVKHLPRKRCNIVISDIPPAADHDVVPDREASPRLEIKSASSQARQWQPTPFALNSVIEDAWHSSNA